MVLAAGLSGHRPLAAAWLKKSTNGARHWLAERGMNHDPSMLNADYRGRADEAGSFVAGEGRRPAGLTGSNDDSPAQLRAICFASRLRGLRPSKVLVFGKQILSDQCPPKK